MATTIRTSNSSLKEYVQEKWIERSWFIFSWWEKVCTTKLGNDLFIETGEHVDRIFINGEEITNLKK